MRACFLAAALVAGACTFEGASPPDEADASDAPSMTVVLLFQAGADYDGVVDTEVDEDNPDGDRSALTSMRFDQSTGNSQGRVAALLQFRDIFGGGAARVPADAVLESATLSLTVVNGGNVPGSLCDMLRPWEGDATWSSFGAEGPQATTDFDPVATAQLLGGLQRYDYDVLSSVQSWHLEERANSGWVMVANSVQGISVATSEADPPARPALEIRFSISR